MPFQRDPISVWRGVCLAIPRCDRQSRRKNFPIRPRFVTSCLPSNSRLRQVPRQERQAEFAREAVRRVEGLLLSQIAGSKHFIYPLDACEAGAAGGDGEDRVALARFGEERPRRDEARESRRFRAVFRSSGGGFVGFLGAYIILYLDPCVWTKPCESKNQ